MPQSRIFHSEVCGSIIVSDMDKETIIREIRRIASELKLETLSKTQFQSNSDISMWQVDKLFDSWNQAVTETGLDPVDVSRIDDEDLFREMRAVFLDNHGICTRSKFDKLCKYSIDTYKNRFGKWPDILLEFRSWLAKSGEDFLYIDQLPVVADRTTVTEVGSSSSEVSKQVAYDPIGATTYGSILNFRGLLHAPVNEQGVVFLFGMVCSDLGFIVEVVQTGYPDCIAKRRIKGKRGTWERVRIEFEYRSSHFNHKSGGCDLVVCWEHDWLQCPNEVLELKAAIQSLSNNGES